jgi:alpha-methylacyl-CoA racemase
MVGDFGGGGMFLAYGVVCALLEAQRSGQGQVVDTAMVDGAAVLMSMFWAFKQAGIFDENAPGTNLLDTGAHFYDVFECADGKYVSLGSIEPQFYAELMRITGLAGDPEFARRWTRRSGRTSRSACAR